MKKILLSLSLLLLTSTFYSCDFSLGITSNEESSSSEKSNNSNQEERIVHYSEFGAVGDGKTDDFKAIKKTHEYANENHCLVFADDDASYYIGPHDETIYIKTETDWGNASFTIDDREVEGNSRKYNVFEISSDKKSYSIEIPNNYSLKRDQSNVNLKFDEEVMLYIENSNKKDYIRYGGNQNNGSNRQEIIIVDKDGNVDKTTPILWDYDEVTSMKAYPIDDKEILIYGGKFTTISNEQDVASGYFARGISVKRSNTTLSGIKHYVTNEPLASSGDNCAPYTGFYAVSYANNVTIEYCTLTGHSVYTNVKPTGTVSQGTYDTTAARSNNVRWVNCTQSNSITDTKYWGVMSSNFCKNLSMENCYLSRFDAHQGVYNATVKNTTLGRDFNIIGRGTVYAENVTRLNSDHFLNLRSDYGSTWEGDIILKDCTFNTYSSSNYLLNGTWVDWEFGYKCYLPETITIDNLNIVGANSIYVYPDKLANLDEVTVNTSKNPISVTDKVILKNQTQEIKIASNLSKLFKNVLLEKQ